jgi:chloramphenicol-sensitive protein RarD
LTELSTSGGQNAIGEQDAQRGTAYGAGAYAIWGAFPLYFHLLAPAGAWEILAHRILWTLLFCAAVLAVRRELRGAGLCSAIPGCWGPSRSPGC